MIETNAKESWSKIKSLFHHIRDEIDNSEFSELDLFWDYYDENAGQQDDEFEESYIYNTDSQEENKRSYSIFQEHLGGHHIDQLDDDTGVGNLDIYMNELQDSIYDRNAETAQELFERVKEICNKYAVNICDQCDEATRILDEIPKSESNIIYQIEPNIYIPQLIINTNESLIKGISRMPNLIEKITPREFEEIIAEIFDKQGFNVQLTKRTRDGGKDIVAIFEKLDIKTRYIIECKRYKKKNKISLGQVQRLYGVKIAEGANKAILATSSFFTRDAKQFAMTRPWDIELKDFYDVMDWIKSY